MHPSDAGRKALGARECTKPTRPCWAKNHWRNVQGQDAVLEPVGHPVGRVSFEMVPDQDEPQVLFAAIKIYY